MGFLCSGDPCKFIFQIFVFSLNIKVLTVYITKQLIGTYPVVRRLVVRAYPWVLTLFFVIFAFFSLTLKRFCDSVRKNAKLKPLKIIQKTLKIGLGDDKTHGLWRPLDAILLSKIEGIYTFNATNLHQNALRNYLKLSQM